MIITTLHDCPEKSYLICATPRTGSYFLCESLTRSGLAGRPAEYFWSGHAPFWQERWGARDYAGYLSGAFREATTPNGVFGAKLMWEYMEEFEGRLRELHGTSASLPVLLAHTFPQVHYIRITRRDKLRQAISACKAIQTNTWMWKRGENRPPDGEFDAAAISRIMQEHARQEAAWDRFFAQAQVEPFTVVYEDLVGHDEEVVYRILDWLAISIPPGHRFDDRYLQRQANEETDRWVEEYLLLKADVP